MGFASATPWAITERKEPIIKRPAERLTVLPSKGLPDNAVGVEFFLPLFLRWRDAHDLPKIESSSPVPEIEQGPVRRIDRRSAA